MRRATASLLTLAFLTACSAGASPSPGAPSGAAPEWTAIAESPLGPRGGVLSAWTGEELLVLGGSTLPPCADGGDCVGPTNEQLLTDGAAYDPATDSWRGIAEAPQTMHFATASWTGTELVVVAPVLEIEATQTAATLVYDPGADRWRTFPGAPAEIYGRGVWNGSELFYPVSETTSGSDWALDPATGQWRQLATDPFGGSFDRSFTWVEDRFLVTALPIAATGGSDGAPYQLAEYRPDSDTWTELSPTTVGFWSPQWWYADGRLVNVSQNAYTAGNDAALPPGGQLDVATGVWSAVPQTDLTGEELFLGCRLPSAGVGPSWVAGSGPLLVSLDPPATMFVPDCAELRSPEVAVWAGEELLVWGGPDQDNEAFQDLGYRWTPPTP